MILGYCTTLKSNVNIQTTSTIAKELLKTGTSATAEALAAKTPSSQQQQPKLNVQTDVPSSSVVTPVNINNSLSSDTIRPKDQLLYLAQLLQFKVNL